MPTWLPIVHAPSCSWSFARAGLVPRLAFNPRLASPSTGGCGLHSDAAPRLNFVARALPRKQLASSYTRWVKIVVKGRGGGELG